MLWIDPSGYTSYLAGKGTEQAYLDTMVSTGAGWVLPGMIAPVSYTHLDVYKRQEPGGSAVPLP